MKTDIPKIDGADRMAVPYGTAFFLVFLFSFFGDEFFHSLKIDFFFTRFND
ncbi:hypothetical protein [Pectobacterium odoriferum]|uniref:hypothetical protein n=1 Tax=Pectobacterium odoriferum TaxID=78398 RepID=UPI0015593CA9|nr:hypothetical protein [Pectobacterium odoriferum]